MLPYFGDNATVYSEEFWHAKLAPYVARKAQPGVQFGQTEIFTNELRKCPAGSFTAPPYFRGTWDTKTWNCWIGANFANYRTPLAGPFYYGKPDGVAQNPPLNSSRIKKAADALIFMDTITHYVYSPADSAHKFTLDMNGDGKPDTMGRYPDTPFNYARATVHSDGANVVLLDGHQERVSFKKLWAVDSANNAVNTFWYLED